MSGEALLRKKRIAVVSQRRSVLDFFRLEAESCGCYVKTMPKLPYELSDYDMIIYDSSEDTKNASPDDGRIYRVRPLGSDKAEGRSLSYPMPVRELRVFFEGGVTAEARSAVEEKLAVIFLGEDGAIYGNRKIQLTDGESRVLARLGDSAGEPVSRRELMELFGAEDGNIADVYICRLRGKLETPFGARLIRTVRGKGYALAAKIEKY